MPVIRSAFKPAWWLKNPHLQTLWPVLLRRKPRPAYRRERWLLADGDFVDLDFMTPAVTDTEKRPFVLLLHGLEGSSASAYARGMMSAIARRGWHGAVLHFRNCSGQPNQQAHSYCAGYTSDLDEVVNRIQQNYPTVAVVAYSLGGSILLNWLAEQGASAPITAAAAVAVPFLLQEAAHRVNHGVSKLYQWHLTRAMRRNYRNKFQHRDDAPYPLEQLNKLKTFTEFDDAITAPLHGYAGVEDYYQRASCRQGLHRIAAPTLIIHAQDDPLMYPQTVPGEDELSSAVRFELSRYGGHVGFVAGTWRAEYWLEQRIPEFFATQF